MIKLGLTTLSFVLLASGASTASASDLTEIYELAKNNDGRMAVAQAARNNQQEVVPQAMARMLPTANFNAFTGREEMENKNNATSINYSDSYDINGYGLNVTQPLFDAEIWYGYKAAKQLENKSSTDLEVAKKQLILRVATSYIEVLRAQNSLVIAKEEERVVKQQLENARKRLKDGLISETDLYEAEAVYDAVKLNRIVAEGEVDLNLENITLLTGKSYTKLMDFSRKLPIGFPAPRKLDHWVSKAERKSLSVKAAEFAYEATKSNVDEVKGRHYPKVNLRASYIDSSNNGANYEGNDFDYEYTASNVVINVNIPLYAGGGVSSEVRRSYHVNQEARANLELQKQLARQGAKNYFNKLKVGEHRIEAAEQTIMSSENAVKSAKKGYEIGIRTLLEVLDAERRFYTAEKVFADAKYDFIINSLKLKLVAGVLEDKDIARLDKYLN